MALGVEPALEPPVASPTTPAVARASLVAAPCVALSMAAGSRASPATSAAGVARRRARGLSARGRKRGLAAALHSGDPAYSALPAYLEGRLRPAIQALLAAAAASGEVRGDVDPEDLLRAVGSLCVSGQGDRDYTRRMVALLIDGLRYSAGSSQG